MTANLRRTRTATFRRAVRAGAILANAPPPNPPTPFPPIFRGRGAERGGEAERFRRIPFQTIGRPGMSFPVVPARCNEGSARSLPLSRGNSSLRTFAARPRGQKDLHVPRIHADHWNGLDHWNNDSGHRGKIRRQERPYDRERMLRKPQRRPDGSEEFKCGHAGPSSGRP